MEVRFLSKEEVYGIRHRVLRPEKAFDDIVYDTDLHEGTFHLGAFEGGHLISVASFNRARIVEGYGMDDTQCTEPHYRLRAMATLPDHRRKGAGRALVEHAEVYLKAQGITLIWCRGRTAVQGYYQALGFKPLGQVYDYPTLGPHITLVKNI